MRPFAAMGRTFGGRGAQATAQPFGFMRLCATTAAACVPLLALYAWSAHGQSAGPARDAATVGAAKPATNPRTLHERPPLRVGTPNRRDRAVGAGGAGKLPTAIDTAHGRIPAPPTAGSAAAASAAAPVYSPPPVASAARPQVRLDAATGAEGALHYRVVFDPSVAPFKRDLAFDDADADGTLRQRGSGRRPMQLQPGSGRPGHELFWGHVRLQLVPGQGTPLPSVAPDAGLLGWQATPALPLQLLRDDAGNVTVRLEPGVAGVPHASAGAATPEPIEVELRFLTDAPSIYFGRPLGDGDATSQPEAPRLSPPLQAQLQALWPLIGARPDKGRRANLEALTQWFRNFEPGAGPRPGAALVSDLIRLRKGICRHRAHGFVLMAWSLGIAAHYVMNDAHAFVEAWAVGEGGDEGWLRIDLGGGAESLELHGADGHSLHTPLHRDPLPRPPAYVAQQSAGMPSAGPGAPPGQTGAGPGRPTGWAGAQRLIGGEAFAARRPPPGGTSATPPPVSSQQAGGGERRPDQTWLAERAAAIAAPRRPPGAESAPVATVEARPSCHLEVRPSGAVAFVGETLRVRGALVASTAEVATHGRMLEVWLVDPRDRQLGVRLGLIRTGDKGAFDGAVALPLDARLGDWDLVVRFAGNRDLGACFSRDR